MFEVHLKGSQSSGLGQLEKRMCVDVQEIKEYLKLKGGYSGFQEERISFSIKGVICDDQKDTSCESKESIDALLKEIQFTNYILEEAVEFGQDDNIGERPTAITDRFYMQFALK
jgi:hypothetical protein